MSGCLKLNMKLHIDPYPPPKDHVRPALPSIFAHKMLGGHPSSGYLD